LWDVASGKEVRRLAGHRGGVHALAFPADGRYLASASSDTTVLLWDARAWPAPPSAKLTPADLKAAWADLDGADAARAFRAISKLAASPAQAVPFLAQHLRPVVAADSTTTAKLIAGLDSKRFAERERSRKGLEELGAAAEPALRRALKGELAPEA